MFWEELEPDIFESRLWDEATVPSDTFSAA
jgi:hypothetical protein